MQSIEPQRMSSANEMVDKVDNVSDRLSILVGRLNDRLNPIMREEHKAVSCGDGIREVDNYPPLMSEITGKCRVINSDLDCLETIIDRIDL